MYLQILCRSNNQMHAYYSKFSHLRYDYFTYSQVLCHGYIVRNLKWCAQANFNSKKKWGWEMLLTVINGLWQRYVWLLEGYNSFEVRKWSFGPLLNKLIRLRVYLFLSYSSIAACTYLRELQLILFTVNWDY